MLQNDIADGNTIEGPSGEVQVAGRLQGSNGTFIVLLDAESGLCALALEGNLIENENWTLKNKVSPSGAAQVEETSQLAAQQSEIDRLTRLTDALVQQQNQPRAVEPDTVDPVSTVPDTHEAEPQVAGAPVPTPSNEV